MNTHKIYLFAFLFSTFSVMAQNYNGQNRFGLNKDVARDYSSKSKPSTEEIEKYKSEQLDKIIAKLKTALTLDELQVIAFRNEIATNMKNVDIVIKKGTSDEEKTTEVKALMDKTEAVINSYLNKDQKEKYKSFVEEGENGKRVKKSKKETAKTE